VLPQLIVTLRRVDARSTRGCRRTAAPWKWNTRYTQDPSACCRGDGLSCLRRLRILQVWNGFDKILLLLEQKHFNGKLPGGKLSKCLRKCRNAVFKIRQHSAALHFGCVCKQQKMIRRHLKPLRVLRAHAGT